MCAAPSASSTVAIPLRFRHRARPYCLRKRAISRIPRLIAIVSVSVIALIIVKRINQTLDVPAHNPTRHEHGVTVALYHVCAEDGNEQCSVRHGYR
jgi:hypothetical protein